MWHVDEGALHAYLDGALDEYPASEARRVREHLEACADCGERLAAERRVREESQDILALASPRVEVPTLEELRAYVKAQAPTRSKASIRLYRLSWAASVVLALGTGWLLRGGVPQTTASGESGFAADRSAASAPSESAERPAPESELERLNEAATRPTDLSAAAEPAPQDAVAGAQRADGAGASSLPPTSSDRPEQTAAGGALLPSGPRRELAERATPPASTGTSVAAPDAAPRSTADVVAGVDTDDAAASKAADDAPADVVAGNVGAAAPPPSGAAAPAPSAPAALADSFRQDTVARDAATVAQRAAEQRLRSAIAQGPAVTGLGAGAAPLGRSADAADASAELAEAEADTEPVSLVVPGLEVVDVLRIGEGTTFLGTRALQLLPSGDTLETAHLPPGVDATVLRPLRPGWSELIEQRGSGWLVMRAPVPPSTLTELLRRLEADR